VLTAIAMPTSGNNILFRVLTATAYRNNVIHRGAFFAHALAQLASTISATMVVFAQNSNPFFYG
jgi:hypothetical protein